MNVVIARLVDASISRQSYSNQLVEMPCLAQQDSHHTKLPAAGHYCKSLSSLIRETYAHCHVPCVRIPAGAGWSSGDDDSVLDDAMETKQVRDS
jgi:hypothetical protein